MRFQIFIISVTLIFFGCKKHKLEKLTGQVQKGPFINGTSINMSELDDDLVPTGKVFSTEIEDDKGSFAIPDVKLKSSFVELTADGFYFDEVAGQLSSAKITLRALSDVANQSSINVNIITTLEKSRVEYLIENGSSFNDAKTQAQGEILGMFNINGSGLGAQKLSVVCRAARERGTTGSFGLPLPVYHRTS